MNINPNLKVVGDQDDTPAVTPREALQAAIELRDACRLRIEKSRATCIRASALVDRLEKALGDFDAVHERVLAARAESFKRALTEGIDEMSPQAPSVELNAVGLRKLEAQSQLAAARQAHDELAADLSSAESELATRQSNVEHAARNVIGERVDEMARDLLAQEKKIGAARARLMGATALRRDGGFKIAPSTMALLRDSPRNLLVATSADDRAWWDSWFSRLTEDPNATADNEF